MDVQKKIGKLIRESRAKKRMTQNELATALNYSDNFVSLVECGRAKVPRSRLRQIIELLDINKGQVKRILVADFIAELEQDLGMTEVRYE